MRAAAAAISGESVSSIWARYDAAVSRAPGWSSSMAASMSSVRTSVAHGFRPRSRDQVTSWCTRGVAASVSPRASSSSTRGACQRPLTAGSPRSSSSSSRRSASSRRPSQRSATSPIPAHVGSLGPKTQGHPLLEALVGDGQATADLSRLHVGHGVPAEHPPDHARCPSQGHGPLQPRERVCDVAEVEAGRGSARRGPPLRLPRTPRSWRRRRLVAQLRHRRRSGRDGTGSAPGRSGHAPARRTGCRRRTRWRAGSPPACRSRLRGRRSGNNAE